MQVSPPTNSYTIGRGFLPSAAAGGLAALQSARKAGANLRGVEDAAPYSGKISC